MRDFLVSQANKGVAPDQVGAVWYSAVQYGAACSTVRQAVVRQWCSTTGGLWGLSRHWNQQGSVPGPRWAASSPTHATLPCPAIWLLPTIPCCCCTPHSPLHAAHPTIAPTCPCTHRMHAFHECSQSFYVGDAAGRPTDIGDGADSDR